MSVARRIVHAATAFKRASAHAHLTISGKSVVIASHSKLATFIVKQLHKEGCAVSTCSAARDLGIQLICGKRRTTLIQRQRLHKAATRSARIVRLSKLTKVARKLVNTGYKPQATWGNVVTGYAPSTIAKVRALYARMTGVNHGSQCTSTLIALAYGYGKDPTVMFTVEAVVTWIKLWRESAQHHAAIRARAVGRRAI